MKARVPYSAEEIKTYKAMLAEGKTSTQILAATAQYGRNHRALAVKLSQLRNPNPSHQKLSHIEKQVKRQLEPPKYKGFRGLEAATGMRPDYRLDVTAGAQ